MPSLYSTWFAQVSAPLPLAAAPEAANTREAVTAAAKSMAGSDDFDG